jgi:ADP-ribose pyrophosphatase YjhB (NUDIX family)
MRALLERLWQRPWPRWLRRLATEGTALPFVGFLLFPHFQVGVVGMIQNGEGQVLLLHHTYRSTPWGLPTGFLERGEQPIDALSREIKEEAGLLVELDPHPIVYAEARRPLVNIAFRGTYAGGSFEASAEVSQARWFSLDALPSMLPGQRELLMTCLQEVSH